MITPDKLHEWKQAKTLAITNPNSDPEAVVAMQEMYIEAKALRRNNLLLLNYQDLNDKFAEFYRQTMRTEYVSPELEELAEEIANLADELGFDLDLTD